MNSRTLDGSHPSALPAGLSPIDWQGANFEWRSLGCDVPIMFTLFHDWRDTHV